METKKEERLVLQALRHRSSDDGIQPDSHAHTLGRQVLIDRCKSLATHAAFSYLEVNGQMQQIALKAGNLAYTIRQMLVTLEVGKGLFILVRLAN